MMDGQFPEQSVFKVNIIPGGSQAGISGGMKVWVCADQPVSNLDPEAVRMGFVPEIPEEGCRIARQSLLEPFQFVDRVGPLQHGDKGSCGESVSDGEHILLRGLDAFVADQDRDAEVLLQFICVFAGENGFRGGGFGEGNDGEQKQNDQQVNDGLSHADRFLIFDYSLICTPFSESSALIGLMSSSLNISLSLRLLYIFFEISITQLLPIIWIALISSCV